MSVSKIVSGIYSLGVGASVILAAGTITSLIVLQSSYSFLGWLSAIGFSGVPLGALLIVAARGEWKRKDLSGVALSFVIVASSLIVLEGIFAHVEYVAALLSILEVVTCVWGYMVVTHGDPGIKQLARNE